MFTLLSLIKKPDIGEQLTGTWITYHTTLTLPPQKQALEKSICSSPRWFVTGKMRELNKIKPGKPLILGFI